MKGIAFAGAIKAAEEAGYTEWVHLGGTSAGAIAAMALAVGYDADQIRDRLASTDYAALADTGGLPGKAINVLGRRGLTRGRALHEWIKDLLRDAPRPATTFGDLERRLQVIGADVAHSRVVVFPDDVGLYMDERGRPFVPDEFSIADAVRISAGYPYFFPPVRLRDRATERDGVLVDGGVVSAFPVFLFDAPNPRQPTWGFRLYSGMGAERPAHNDVDGLDWPIEMAWAILDTAMNAFDNRELLTFRSRTVSIPTGDVGTLDFDLSRDEIEFLYGSGYEASRTFFASNPSGRNSLGAVAPAQA